MLLGLIVRLAFGLGYWIEKPLTHDEREYLALATSLATGQGFRYPPPSPQAPEAERFGRAPAYPVFVAVVMGDTLTTALQSSPRPIKIAQSVVGTFGVLLVAALAWRIGGPTAGATAAAIAAVYPPLVWICAYVLSEALYSTLALATLLVVDVVIHRTAAERTSGSVWMLFGAGVLGGITTLTRPVMLIFVALIGIWFVYRRLPRLASVWILGAVLVIAPWTIRNAQEHGRLILVASEGGITFWTGNHPLAQGEGDMAANPGIKSANRDFRARHAGLTSEQLESIYYREALSHILAHPVWWVGLLARKFFFLWVPIGPSYTLHSSLYLWASVVSYGLILAPAVAGAVALWRQRRTPVGLTLMAASLVIASLAFFPQERFRIPVLDPMFIICAATWLASTTTRGRLSQVRTG